MNREVIKQDNTKLDWWFHEAVRFEVFGGSKCQRPKKGPSPRILSKIGSINTTELEICSINKQECSHLSLRGRVVKNSTSIAANPP